MKLIKTEMLCPLNSEVFANTASTKDDSAQDNINMYKKHYKDSTKTLINLFKSKKTDTFSYRKCTNMFFDR